MGLLLLDLLGQVFISKHVITMTILKDLPNLVEAEVISQETADRIQTYYESRGDHSVNRLLIAFGVLGAILVGLGIILIVAHNWDELSKGLKTVFAFTPLLIGQALCGYVLLKRPESVAWRESTSSFLFFAVGSSISLIGQIYNIPGNLSPFILTWMLLVLPLAYVMRSSICSLMYLIGITYYACNVGYWTYPADESYWYFALLIGILPFYYLLYKEKPYSNFTIFHHWLIPLSLMISLGIIEQNGEELLVLVYMALFGLFYGIGQFAYFKDQKSRNQGYTLMGSLGTIILLLGLSFDWFWEDLRRSKPAISEIIMTSEFVVTVILSLLAIGIYVFSQQGKKKAEIKVTSFLFIGFVFIFFLGLSSALAAILVNIGLFVIGVLTIRDGAKQNHLGLLNYGLLIIAALIACRFFDTELSFVIRGLLFMLVGLGFFATNYWMLKKRNSHGV